MSDRKPTYVVVPAIVSLAVLLVIYAGAYFWAVVPRLGIDENFELTGKMLPHYPRLQNISSSLASYRRWENFFAPMHWLDRRIRPHVWSRRNERGTPAATPADLRATDSPG